MWGPKPSKNPRSFFVFSRAKEEKTPLRSVPPRQLVISALLEGKNMDLFCLKENWDACIWRVRMDGRELRAGRHATVLVEPESEPHLGLHVAVVREGIYLLVDLHFHLQCIASASHDRWLVKSHSWSWYKEKENNNQLFHPVEPLDAHQMRSDP